MLVNLDGKLASVEQIVVNDHGISDSERLALMNWIKAQVVLLRAPFCWRDSYGRGGGTLVDRCPEG